VTGLAREKPDEKQAVTATLSVANDSALASSEDRDFVNGLTQSLKLEAELVEKYSPLVSTARKLSARSGQLLASVDTDFKVESRRAEVSEELGAAKLILDAVAERSEKISAGALSFLKTLADSFPPPEPAAPVASKADASKTKPKKNGSKPAAAPKPKPETAPPKPKPEAAPSKPKPDSVAESAKPAPKPAPAPAKPADDFNP
jgi:hypothetical protein